MTILTGVHLSFALSNYRCFISVAEDSYFKIVYDLKHDDWDELKLKNGNDLLSMPGTIHLRADDEPLSDPKVIGALHYIDANEGSDDGVIRESPQHFSVECSVPRATLDRIFDAEKFGLGPTNVGVSVSGGVNYGHLPDGSDMIWTSENDWAYVSQLSFSFRQRPSGDAENSADEEQDEPENALDTIKNAIEAIGQKLDKGLLIITGLLTLIAALAIFK